MPTSFLQSRSKVLRRRPLVVGTLTGQASLNAQLTRARSPYIDVVELRLDTFTAVHKEGAKAFALALMHRVRKVTRKPVLLTFRSHTESGTAVRAEFRAGDSLRESVVAPLLPLAALVDVEARRVSYAARVGAVARRLGVGVIHSYHDFKGARLAGPRLWAARAAKKGADVFKVALSPKTDRELDAFLGWGLSLDGPRVLIGMGPEAAMTRQTGFTFGSILTYGHLGRSAAPGQVAAADLGRRIRLIYGAKK